ncbi:hypothetical protein JOM56_000560 [Amanita muscaria]
MGPLLGLGSFQSYITRVSPSPENDTLQLHKWRQSNNLSVAKIQQIIFQVANIIQYVHSFGIALHPAVEWGVHYLDSDEHATVQCPSFSPSCLSDSQVLFNYPDEFTIEIRPEEPQIPDNVWQLIQWCCGEDPKERPMIDQVIQEMESWISLGQFTRPF